jgi:3-hydroxyisobutyrate dehydrogenase-like beta-hydroxyacid dehydrogenase
MGASLAAACTGERLWVSDGRTDATRERARDAGLIDTGSLRELAERADVIVSVCPPAAALAQAEAVTAVGYDGIYVDANAVSPSTARQISHLFDRFVDGGIIGPPVRQPGSTRLYLAGEEATGVAALWNGSALDVRVLDAPAGAASAVKVCFAAWTKGSAALLLAIRGLAHAEGIDDALLDEWAISIPDLAEQSKRTAFGNAPKAWRFVGEMEQIAAAFDEHDLPAGFAAAAADLYRRLATFKDGPSPTLDLVVDAIVRSEQKPVDVPGVDHFVELECKVWDALASGDPDADAALLTDDFLGVYPTGFADRAEHAAQLENGPTVAAYELAEPRLTVASADDVLLSYRATFVRPNQNDSEAAPLIWNITSLWTRIGDRWLNRFSQDTPAS